MTNTPRRRPTGVSRATQHKARLALEALETREVPAALVGLTTANQLISIPSDNPTSSSGFGSPPTPITGLAAGELVVGIDFRPRTGQLYALAVDGNGTGTSARLLTLGGFTLNNLPAAVAATQVGAFTVPAASPDARYGFDFNPALDVIRVVNSADAFFRLDPDTGAVLGFDPPITPPGLGINAAAYDRNFDARLGPEGTTLYAISTTAPGALVRITEFLQRAGPVAGAVVPVGPLGVAIDPIRAVGFDIQANPGAAQGPAFAVFDADPTAAIAVGLYSINLATGAASLVGPVGTGTLEVSGLAVVPESSVALGVRTQALPADSFAQLLVVGDFLPTPRAGFPNQVTPFVGYRGALATAVADVNRDAIPDLVVAAATAGNNGHVKVFSGVDGSLLMSFFAFEGFAGGVLLAAGDVGGGPGGAADGFADVVVVAGNGGNGHVKAFSGADGALLASFFSFPGFLGPVSVAVSDLDLDRTLFRDEIVVAAGSNGHVKAFNVDGSPFGGVSFFAFEGFAGPVNLAGGDVTGDGFGDIVVGTGVAVGHVKVFSGAPGNPPTLSFLVPLASTLDSGFGVSVGTTDGDRDGRLDIAVAPLSGELWTTPRVPFFDGLTGESKGFLSISFGTPIRANSGAYVSGGRA